LEGRTGNDKGNCRKNQRFPWAGCLFLDVVLGFDHPTDAQELPALGARQGLAERVLPNRENLVTTCTGAGKNRNQVATAQKAIQAALHQSLRAHGDYYSGSLVEALNLDKIQLAVGSSQG
jgi:hypothetical protein